MGVRLLPNPLPIDIEKTNTHNGGKEPALTFNRIERDLLTEWHKTSATDKRELVYALVKISNEYVHKSQ